MRAILAIMHNSSERVRCRLDDLIEIYLSSVEANLSESTLKAYRTRLKRFQRFVNGRVVTKELADEWCRAIRQEPGISPNTAAETIATVRRFCFWLVEEEFIAVNPVRMMPRFSRVKIDRPMITQEEHAEIVKEADRQDDDNVWAYAVRCGWETGLPLSDVALLQWSGVLWEVGGIRVRPRQTSRFGKVCEMRVSDEFMGFLKLEWLNHSCPTDAFVSPMLALKYRASPRQVSASFVSLAARAKVCKTFKAYRDGFIARCIPNGLGVIAAQLAGIPMSRYTEHVHFTMLELRRAMGLEPVHR